MTLRDTLTNDQRPRERLLKFGANNLTDAELLAILLGSGTRRLNVIEFAQMLLSHHQGLRQLLATPTADLMRVDGMGCLLYTSPSPRDS